MLKQSSKLTNLVRVVQDRELDNAIRDIANILSSTNSNTDSVENLQIQMNALTPANQLLSGGVTYSGSGLTYDVSALIYRILDVTYTSNPISLTLTASDPTDPRIDVIYVDDNGVVGSMAGTPNPSPVKPIVDDASQLELTFVTVAAGATTPTLSVEDVYNENAGTPTEWAGTTNGTVDFASTNDPYLATVSIETTAVLANGEWIKLTPDAPYAINGGVLGFRIKAKVDMSGNSGRLRVGFFNSGALVGNTVQIGGSVSSTFGFVGSNISDHQNVVIDITNFGTLPSTVDELRIYRQGKKEIERVIRNHSETYAHTFDNVSIQEIPTTPAVTPPAGLPSVLGVDNTTGGLDLDVSDGDDIVMSGTGTGSRLKLGLLGNEIFYNDDDDAILSFIGSQGHTFIEGSHGMSFVGGDLSIKKSGVYPSVFFGDGGLDIGTLSTTPLTADRTWTFPDDTGTIALTSDITSSISGTTNTFPIFTGANTIGDSNLTDTLSNLIWGGLGLQINNVAGNRDAYLFGDGIWFTNTTSTFRGDFRVHAGIPLTATRTWDMPDASGTVALTSDIVNFSTGNLTFAANRLHDLSSNTLEILGTGDYLGGWFYQDGSSIAIGNGNGGEPNQCRIRMIANGQIEMQAGNADKIYVTSTRTEILSDLALTIGSFDGVFTHANTADRTYTLPDNTGTVALTSDVSNFADTDLTATGNRTHSTNGNYLIISSDGATLAKSWMSIQETRNEIGFANTWDRHLATSKEVFADNTLSYTVLSTGISLEEGKDLITGTTTGSNIGATSSQKIGLWGVTPVVQPTALTAAETTITNAGTASDYAIQAMTNTSPYGFVTQAEAETLVEVVLNNQLRIAELESKLQAIGAIA